MKTCCRYTIARILTITELRIAVLAQRRVQRDGVHGHTSDLRRPSAVMSSSFRQFRGGFTTQVLQHLALDGQAQPMTSTMCTGMRTRLVSHRSRSPDGSTIYVGRELVNSRVVKLFDRATRPRLPNEVQELRAATGVALSQRHDQTQVGLEQVVLRPLTILGQAQLATLALVISSAWFFSLYSCTGQPRWRARSTSCSASQRETCRSA